jgi:hypothetical protein
MNRLRVAILVFLITILSFPWYPVWWFTLFRVACQFFLGCAIVFSPGRLRYVIINEFPHKQPFALRMRLKVGRHRHEDYGVPKQTLMGVIEEEL